jgi:hypothetical protein
MSLCIWNRVRRTTLGASFSNSSFTPGRFLAAPKYRYPGPLPLAPSTALPALSVIFGAVLA